MSAAQEEMGQYQRQIMFFTIVQLSSIKKAKFYETLRRDLKNNVRLIYLVLWFNIHISKVAELASENGHLKEELLETQQIL